VAKCSIRVSLWKTLYGIRLLDKTTSRIRGTTPSIELAARELRQNLTPAEQILWQALRMRQLNGLKFRCQHPVGRFIIDFFCPQYKLAIELDGDIHEQQAEYDATRSEQLKTYGYHVLRVRNEEVFTDLSSVLQRILEAISEDSTPPKSPKSGGL
jgi:very-short-patch-repair endonuclease